MHRLGWSILLLSGLLVSCQAGAAERAHRGTLSLVLENDLFYNLDQHYTNGVRLSWVPASDAPTPAWAMKLAHLVPWMPGYGRILHGYAVGQSMYTPSDIKLRNPPLQDRPYAGWLYGTLGIGVESDHQLDVFAITLGMVGPASLAGPTQTFIHKLVGSDRPQGWGTQLKNEPGIVLDYQHSWRGFVATSFFGNQFDVTPNVGAAIGNVFTYADTGLMVRYGRRLPDDFGPPRIQPGIPGTSLFSPTANMGGYVFAGIEGRAVAHNIFLDGNTFQNSRSVKKRPLVGDLQFGFVLDWPRIRLSYTHVIRTKEFQTQQRRDDFGALTMSLKL